MAELVVDCPRCGASKMTFDVRDNYHIGTRYNWQNVYEVFSTCRGCHLSSTFILSNESASYAELSVKAFSQSGALNNYYRIEGYVSLKDHNRIQPPEHVPQNIKDVFNEGTTCLAVKCFNAAGTMFRLCLDIATGALLPPATDSNGPDAITRPNLGRRIRWLLDNGRLPEPLRELSTCVREDGNDGAHAGTLEKADAENLLDFTVALLERLYTEPERLRLAQQRRNARRQPVAPSTN